MLDYQIENFVNNFENKIVGILKTHTILEPSKTNFIADWICRLRVKARVVPRFFLFSMFAYTTEDI